MPGLLGSPTFLRMRNRSRVWKTTTGPEGRSEVYVSDAALEGPLFHGRICVWRSVFSDAVSWLPSQQLRPIPIPYALRGHGRGALPRRSTLQRFSLDRFFSLPPLSLPCGSVCRRNF